MIPSLAEELLRMVLASALTIPPEQFNSASGTAFGANDTVSTASTLLVCKRWLRIATPLLYEAVVIRSAGQSRALARTLRLNPSFSLHVKKVRIEGAYPSLGDVLAWCTNIETLVILFRIYSDASVKALCRVLPKVDPTEFILHDNWKNTNKKAQEVFVALCDAIPRWKSFARFEYPYHHPDSGWNATVEPNTTRRDRLLDALTKSPSIRIISCPVPELDINLWLPRFGLIPSVTLKFTYSSKVPWQIRSQKSIRNLVSKDSRLSKVLFEFIDTTRKSHPPQDATMSSSGRIPDFSFRLTSVSSVPKPVWTAIFSFATIPDYRISPDAFYNTYLSQPSALHIDLTRKSLSLVCKTFEELIRPLFFDFPLILSIGSFRLLVKKVLQYPDLGHQIRVLSLMELGSMMGAIDEYLCVLIPRLTCLRHYIGCNPVLGHQTCISNRAFKVLSEAAGSTLTTITCLDFSEEDGPLPFSIFASFKVLDTLHIPSQPPRIADTLHPDSFPSLRELRLGRPSAFLDSLSVLGLSQLRSVTLSGMPFPSVERFFKACGSLVEELRLEGLADMAVLFSLAPNLVILRWRPESSPTDRVLPLRYGLGLNTPAAHAKLAKLTLEFFPDNGSNGWEYRREVSCFFAFFEVMGFPSLKEIVFPNYKWPEEERAIMNDPLPDRAVEFQENYGIVIKGHNGQLWRKRTDGSLV